MGLVVTPTKKTKKKQRIAVFGGRQSTKHCYTLVFLVFQASLRRWGSEVDIWGSLKNQKKKQQRIAVFGGYPNQKNQKKPTYSSVWWTSEHQTLLYVVFFGFPSFPEAVGWRGGHLGKPEKPK